MMIFKTKVINIGPEAEMFKSENMLILFGENAPATLADYCYNIELRPSTGAITPGMLIYFDDTSYRITAVGNVAKKNLDDLGHISLRFNGATEAELPGTIYVEDKTLPTIKIGTQVSIG
ncbi:PTS glucitol/sorbitol transporter subunit IIA [Enterococcus sp. CSURQ0835]|uniref:PTS glucitol/sorbitol transporter subunit IIA n=1 Tax=Enterococcus sp. CSURQ0835 TaxID=2681394 RepID=UPI0013579553|nr:PTS glucitol/sorbitol transporter subunit IIA [Enterococcus sp. CSURQ0835]